MKKFIKRLSLGVITCISMSVITTITSFAWFGGSTGGSDTTFTTGEVSIEETESSDTVLTEFKSSVNALQAHILLENSLQDVIDNFGLQSEIDKVLYDWWISEYNNNNLRSTYSPYVKSGNLVYLNYEFKNNSNVPVYFRIAKPAIEVIESSKDISVSFVAYWMNPENTRINEWDYYSESDIILVEGKDGYYYCPKPFYPGENMNIMFTGYFLNLGVDAIKAPELSLSYKGAEVIQATNNAVYLAEGWSDIAVTDFFYTLK